MKNLITALVIIMASSFAVAKDSFWAICIGDAKIFDVSSKLVINIYEHRTKLGWATDLTLIYGGHVLRGRFDSSENDHGTVALKAGPDSFMGVAAMDYPTNKVSLKGVLDLQEKTTLKVTLACETLGD